MTIVAEHTKVIERGLVARCPHCDPETGAQCADVDEHMGYHSAPTSAAQVLLWPSLEQIAEAQQDARIAAMTDEQVMHELTGGDPAEVERVNSWAGQVKSFTRSALDMRKRIRELTAERDALRGLAKTSDDE